MKEGALLLACTPLVASGRALCAHVVILGRPAAEKLMLVLRVHLKRQAVVDSAGVHFNMFCL